MNKVKIPVWVDSNIILSESNKVACQLRNKTKRIIENNFYKDDYEEIVCNIKSIFVLWTGYTFVGKEKDKKTKKAFQLFFVALYDFLIACKNSNNAILQEFANQSLFQGKVYRYLPISDNLQELDYNDVYVSWSKNSKNTYIESKLTGDYYTILTCDIRAPFYGIDIEAFGESRGEEREVVFPTIKELIVAKTTVKWE